MSRLLLPIGCPARACISVPGSKSITNRALLLAALTPGAHLLTGWLDSDDTQAMRNCLTASGCNVSVDPAGRLVVHGARRLTEYGQADLYVDNAGTAARFLVAAAAAGEGVYRFDGSPRMRERPMALLIDALRTLGASITERGAAGCFPLDVKGRDLTGGALQIRGDVSSQFISALMMIGPLTAQGVSIHVDGPLVSAPFVTMTARMMEAFGAHVVCDLNRGEIRCESGGYRRESGPYAIEPDATAASYFWAAAAVTGGAVTVRGLASDSLQGDVEFTTLLQRMGCSVIEAPDGLSIHGPERLSALDADMSGISDTFLTLAAIAPYADAAVTIRGVEHARHQECDRVAAVCSALKALGVSVEEYADGLRIFPAERVSGEAATRNDHRMAMSLAVCALRSEGIRIDDPECVAKTFPTFWQVWEDMYEQSRRT